VGLLFAALSATTSAWQLLPPPGDGDIRVAYYELQNRSEVWLTIEPRAPNGDRAPLLTFTHHFLGKRQTAAPREVLVQACAGQFWAPRAELWFDLDGKERLDVSPGLSNVGLLVGAGGECWGGEISIDAIYRMALVQHVRGSSLGFPFDLSASQRQALRAWLDRIDPGSLTPFLRPRE
jgi:hypothetical protein